MSFDREGIDQNVSKIDQPKNVVTATNQGGTDQELNDLLQSPHPEFSARGVLRFLSDRGKSPEQLAQEARQKELNDYAKKTMLSMRRPEMTCSLLNDTDGYRIIYHSYDHDRGIHTSSTEIYRLTDTLTPKDPRKKYTTAEKIATIQSKGRLRSLEVRREEGSDENKHIQEIVLRDDFELNGNKRPNWTVRTVDRHRNGNEFEEREKRDPAGGIFGRELLKVEEVEVPHYDTTTFRYDATSPHPLDQLHQFTAQVTSPVTNSPNFSSE
jgi:hypothetical protein